MSIEPPVVTKVDDPDYPFHLDLPWGNVGRVEVKLSTESARVLARTITEADRPGEVQCPCLCIRDGSGRTIGATNDPATAVLA